MNRPVWQRWWFAAMAFVVVAGFLAWLLPGPQADLVLADGRQVSLLQTTLGTKHELEEGSLFARVAAKFFGARRAARFGYRIHSIGSRVPAMTVWTEWLTDGSNRPPRYASIRAPGGFETEPMFLAAESASSDKRRSVLGWKFENYPRRADSLELRFHDRPPPYRPNPLGSLPVPNSPERSMASFGGKPAPLSVEDGGVTFTLKSLVSGQELPFWRRGTESGLAPWTTATFEVREGGVVATNWTVRRIEALGATSNAFRALYALPRRDGLLSAGFANVLWPDEPDWNVTAEFVRTADYRESDLWTLRNVPVAEGRMTRSTNFIAGVHGGVSVKMSLTPGLVREVRGDDFRANTSLKLSFSALVPEMSVEVVRAADQHGRTIRSSRGYAIWPSTGPSEDYVTGLELAPDTEMVDVTFAFQRPRLVTFVVKPTFVRTNFDSAFPRASK